MSPRILMLLANLDDFDTPSNLLYSLYI